MNEMLNTSTVHLDGKELSAELGQLLLALGEKATTCESCTAGAVADAISWAPGASAWFDAGLVCYSESAKTALAGVDPALFTSSGVVSSDVALAMASGAAKAAGARFAVATTGRAGPGGTPSPRGMEIPCGFVCFAVVDEFSGACKLTSATFDGDRAQVRQGAARRAMELLLDLTRSAKARAKGVKF